MMCAHHGIKYGRCIGGQSEETDGNNLRSDADMRPHILFQFHFHFLFVFQFTFKFYFHLQCSHVNLYFHLHFHFYFLFSFTFYFLLITFQFHFFISFKMSLLFTFLRSDSIRFSFISNLTLTFYLLFQIESLLQLRL